MKNAFKSLNFIILSRIFKGLICSLEPIECEVLKNFVEICVAITGFMADSSVLSFEIKKGKGATMSHQSCQTL